MDGSEKLRQLDARFAAGEVPSEQYADRRRVFLSASEPGSLSDVDETADIGGRWPPHSSSFGSGSYPPPPPWAARIADAPEESVWQSTPRGGYRPYRGASDDVALYSEEDDGEPPPWARSSDDVLTTEETTMSHPHVLVEHGEGADRDSQSSEHTAEANVAGVFPGHAAIDAADQQRSDPIGAQHERTVGDPVQPGVAYDRTPPPWTQRTGTWEPGEETAWPSDAYRVTYPPPSESQPPQPTFLPLDAPLTTVPATPLSAGHAEALRPKSRRPAHRRTDGFPLRLCLTMLTLIIVLVAALNIWRALTSSNFSVRPSMSPSSSAVNRGASRVVPGGNSSGSSLSTDAQDPFGILRGTIVSGTGSGPATLAQAVARNVIYPEEVDRLTECGARSGQTEVVVGESGWSLSGTVFRCARAAGAHAVMARLENWERSRRFTEINIGKPGVVCFYGTWTPHFPGYPAQYHVRYASGNNVVGLAIQAKTMSIGRDAVESVLGGATAFYPPN